MVCPGKIVAPRFETFATISAAFYVDNQDRGSTAGDKAGALLYGTFDATPANQMLTINASTTIAQNLTVQGTGNSYFAGNVGIGTTSPQSTLYVSGAGSGSYDGVPALGVFESGPSGAWNILFRNTVVGPSGDVGFHYVRSGILELGSAGLDSGLTTWDFSNYPGTSTEQGDFVTLQNDSTPLLYSDHSNNSVGIATDTPWRTLSVTGTVGFDGLTGATGAGSLCLSSNKEVVYNSGSDNCLSSLRSTKNDINNLTLSGTSTVAALVPVSFVYNNDASSTVRYGFIAEDTAAVDAHLGTYDQSGKLSGVDDRSILSIIVKALQELIATVAGFAHSFASDNITANNSLCVKKSDGTPICITGDQLSAVLSGTGQSPSNPVQISAGTFTIASPSPSSNEGTTTSTTTDTIVTASSTPPTSPPTDATTSAATSTTQ
jgi:Chaperone of endosialidase